MKYVMTWKRKRHGTTAAHAAAEARVMALMQDWRKPETVLIHQFVVRSGDTGGYAVIETEDPVGYARAKLLRKNVDFVVANHAGDSFGKETNIVTLVDAERAEPLPVLDKHSVADRILDRMKQFGA